MPTADLLVTHRIVLDPAEIQPGEQASDAAERILREEHRAMQDAADTENQILEIEHLL